MGTLTMTEFIETATLIKVSEEYSGLEKVLNLKYLSKLQNLGWKMRDKFNILIVFTSRSKPRFIAFDIETATLPNKESSKKAKKLSDKDAMFIDDISDIVFNIPKKKQKQLVLDRIKEIVPKLLQMT